MGQHRNTWKKSLYHFCNKFLLTPFLLRKAICMIWKGHWHRNTLSIQSIVGEGGTSHSSQTIPAHQSYVSSERSGATKGALYLNIREGRITVKCLRCGPISIVKQCFHRLFGEYNDMISLSLTDIFEKFEGLYKISEWLWWIASGYLAEGITKYAEMYTFVLNNLYILVAIVTYLIRAI